MAKNDLKIFAGGSSANVMTQAEYEAMLSLINGFSTGVAQSKQLNKVWRQASFAAAMIGLFTGNNSGEDVLDDSDVDGFEAKFARALRAFIANQTATGSFWQPVVSMTITAPPASPTIGDAYIIPAAATGAWEGNSQSVAVWMGAAWKIFVAKNGHGAILPDGRVFEKIAGTYVEKLALDTQSGKWVFGTAAGSASAITVALSPAVPAYVTGLAFRLLITASSTGPATVNVNGLGAKAIQRPDGTALSANDMLAGSILTLVYDGTAFRLVATSTTAKIRLTGPLTVWVRTDGNDNNDGSANTAAKAFKTLSGAMDAVKYIYDTSGFSVTFRLGLAGAYSAGLSIEGFSGGVNIIGDIANRNAYVLTSPGQQTINNRVSRVLLEGVLLENTYNGSSQPIFYVGWPGSSMTFKDMGFRRTISNNSCRVIYLSGGASVSTQGTLNIFASGADVTIEAFMVCDVGSAWVGGEIVNPTSIGLTNMVFSRAFCAVVGAQANFAGTVFTGVSRGKRYEVSLCGAINTAGAGANYLPGDAAGTVSSGGVYV